LVVTNANEWKVRCLRLFEKLDFKEKENIYNARCNRYCKRSG
jgi:hypothetical protein